MTFEEQPVHRQLFASQVLAKAGVTGNLPLLTAFAKVERERFLGPPPWFYNDFSNYRELASGDPVVLYQDVLVALDRDRHINNGVPSLHASALDQLAIGAGERIVHAGAGTGYYTAILAELVGPAGRVTAVEYDGELAERARRNLCGYPNVEFVQGEGTLFPQSEAHVIYVNFAIDHPAAAWVDHLSLNGRLLFPLGVPALDEHGKALSFSRKASLLLVDRRETGFGARFLQPVSFIFAEGQDPSPPGRWEGLDAAFQRRIAHKVRQLRWRRPPGPDEWYCEEMWGLSLQEL